MALIRWMVVLSLCGISSVMCVCVCVCVCVNACSLLPFLWVRNRVMVRIGGKVRSTPNAGIFWPGVRGGRGRVLSLWWVVTHNSIGVSVNKTVYVNVHSTSWPVFSRSGSWSFCL